MLAVSGKGLFGLLPPGPAPDAREAEKGEKDRERRLKEAEEEWRERRREAARWAERFRKALLRANRAEREALAELAAEGVVAAAREALLSGALKAHAASAAKRGVDLAGIPIRVGSAAEPLLFCRRCGFALSATLACACADPDPALLVPSAAVELPGSEREKERAKVCLDFAWWEAWAEVAVKAPLDRFSPPEGFREARIVSLES